MFNIFKWVKSIIFWLLIKKNRNKSLKVFKQILDAVHVVSKLTKTKKDDDAVKNIENHLKSLPSFIAEDVIEKVNNTKKGSMKSLNIGYNKKQGVNAGITVRF